MDGVPLTPDECVAAVVRAYGRERRRGIPAVQAISNVAERLGVQEDAVRWATANQEPERSVS